MTAPPKDPPSDAWFGLLLLLGALAPRIYVALAYASEPVWDGHYYDFGARRIAMGFGYSDDLAIGGHVVWHPWCHYPVGYSGFLAGFYALFGASSVVAGAVNACVGALLAGMTWLLAKTALSSTRARIAGIVIALHPGLILYSALVMTEQLAALLTLFAFWLSVRPSRAGGIFAALALGVSALVRPQALLCAPFLGAASFMNRANGTTWRRRLGIAAILGVGLSALALVPVLPWTLRNCRVMDGCALVSTNAGWNLAIGSFPRATGRFETLRSSDGCRDVTGQVQQDRCWFAYGVQQIRDNPGRFASLIGKKLGYTFDHESFAVEYLHEARPELWPEDRRERGRAIASSAHRILLCASAFGGIALALRGRRGAVQGALFIFVGLLGFVAYASPSPTFWPLAVVAATLPLLPLPGRAEMKPALALCAVLLGTTIVTHAVFFGEDRYHVVVTPALAVLAAAALRRPERRATRARGY